MAEPQNDNDTTFTQAQVNAIVQERLKRERDQASAKYADYDDLKAKAEGAEKDRSQLEKLGDQVKQLNDRAVKAERENLRAGVAAARKLPAYLARKLSGDTKEELEADADEALAAWKEASGKVDDDKAVDTAKTPPTDTDPPVRRMRPREDLKSGAPADQSPPEETDPLKLAALIRRH